MFDIAWSELLIIGVVALVVVGPKDLPKLMRTAGQWAGKARTMADQFRRSFDDMARSAELDELRAQVTKIKNSPMSDKDYESFGIKPSDLAPRIEDVGASPPAPSAPAATPAAAQPPVAQASSSLPPQS